jgi:hypothetical protein
LEFKLSSEKKRICDFTREDSLLQLTVMQSQSIFSSRQIKISSGRRKKSRLPLHVEHAQKTPHIVGLFVFCMRDCVGAIKCAAESKKRHTRAKRETKGDAL